jgi:thymidylate kinase
MEHLSSQENRVENASKGELFRDAVLALKRADHKLCILHGYKDYPEYIGSDVDTISADAAQIPRVLAESEAATVVQAIHTQPTAAFWYALCRWREGKPVFLRLHVFYDDYRIDGRVFFEGEEFLRTRRPFKFFEVPPPDLEFAAYLVKRAAKGSLDEAQGERLSELYDADPVGCRRRLARLLPEAEAELVAEAAQSGDWEAVRGRTDHLYRAMKDRVGREQPLKVLRNRLDDLRRQVGRALRPSGLMVAVLGVDGAGKSTVMARVEQDLAPAFWSTKLYHGRALDSPLRWTKRVRQERRERDLIKRELESAATANPHAVPLSRDPHDKPSRGLALSLVKLGLWWTDYTLLGYVADVYPRLRRSGLVLFDRYYHDLLVDPTRHRYGGPLWLARLAGRVFPQPDLVILLDAPPEVLHARKQEVSLGETARQREAYLELVEKLPNGHVVDASKPVHEVVADAERIILDHVAARTARRLKSRGR